jgi:hypothetical protein
MHRRLDCPSWDGSYIGYIGYRASGREGQAQGKTAHPAQAQSPMGLHCSHCHCHASLLQYLSISLRLTPLYVSALVSALVSVSTLRLRSTSNSALVPISLRPYALRRTLYAHSVQQPLSQLFPDSCTLRLPLRFTPKYSLNKLYA